MVSGLKNLGADVEVVAVEGSWPEASARERRRLGSLVGAWEPETGEQPAEVIVDGLVAVGAPDELEYAAKAKRTTWVLAHMVVPEASGAAAIQKEARALHAASGVIATSSSTATALGKRHGLRRVHIALPGVDAAPSAAGSQPPRIINVAALLPNKDQLLTLEALALIKDLEWTAALVGSGEADPEYSAKVRAAVARHGLERRVDMTGELTGDALEAAWNAADLSLLVSQAEAFGMVVTESLARGIPVVVRDGTGAVEALGLANLETHDGGPRLPGTSVPLAPGDRESPERLAGVLRHWLEDAATRDTWQAAAMEARKRLPGWDQTAATVLAALNG
jgi:glycosyltransferase involved in cell wall biosynthesis